MSRGDELWLRRKWTLRSHGRQVVFVKKPVESTEHVLMKAMLWALYLPLFPDIRVEVPIADRYKPDLVQLNEVGRPLFWAEAGRVSRSKIDSLARRYPDTHFAIAKWNSDLSPLADAVTKALKQRRRRAPIDLLAFPEDSAERFFGLSGEITLSFGSIEFRRLGAAPNTRRQA